MYKLQQSFCYLLTFCISSLISVKFTLYEMLKKRIKLSIDQKSFKSYLKVNFLRFQKVLKSNINLRSHYLENLHEKLRYMSSKWTKKSFKCRITNIFQ